MTTPLRLRCWAEQIRSDGATGTGGVFGYPQARFQQRDPELVHQDHAVARGMIRTLIYVSL